MKTHVLLALVGLVTGLLCPALAQEKSVDPQTLQGVENAAKLYDAAFNNNDAVAIGALFTSDAVESGPEGTAYGQAAIQQRYAGLFAKWKPKDHLNTIEKVYMLGDEAVAVIKWSVGGYGGYVVTVNSHQGDNWLTHLAVYGITTTPAPSPSPTTTPTSQ
jgi:ketosteroid isomerase-like protein